MINHPNRNKNVPQAPKPEEIKALRERCGLTQTEAAALIDWGLRGWQYVEAGKKPMFRKTWALWKHLAGIEAIPFVPRGK